MSQSNDVATTKSDAPTMEEERPEPLTFTLHVVSPSVGVSGPLNFPHLPATTTIKELKAKIRDALPTKPADDRQRLIHRGRMLGRENETMLDVFGQEELANPQSQTLHLVLRPTASDAAPTPQAAANPIAVPQPTNPFNIPPPPTFPMRPQSTPANPIQGMHAQQPLPQPHQTLHQFYQHPENNPIAMAQRLQLLQRESQRIHQELAMLEQRTRANANIQYPGAPYPGPQVQPGQLPFGAPPGMFQLPHRPPPAVPSAFQNLINQQQRERAAEGRNGAQDRGNSTSPPRLASRTASGRASPIAHRPDHSSTYTREGIGPNGERWHVTVNETTTTLPIPQVGQSHHSSPNGSPNPAADIHSVMRNADRFLANQAARNGLHRSASNPAMNQPGATSMPGFARPGTPAGLQPPGMQTPVPPTGYPSYIVPNPNPNLLNQINLNLQNPQNLQTRLPPPPGDGVVAYLLSSPSGPRGLVISNAETFYTPRYSRRHISPVVAPDGQPPAQDPVALPEFRNRDRARDARRAARRIIRAQGELGGANRAHANPGAGAMAAQIVPMLWLILRLVGFVWFLTAGTQSWTRWFLVSTLAFIVFIYNTGIFNGVAEQLWGPIRRHLEALIPLAGPNAVMVPAANAAIPPQAGAAGNNNTPRRRPGELNEAEVAARLIEQRRQANEGWVLAQFRRLEHSLLLFLASLVPGVGERHIAAREAEASAAEAERQRQIEAANAAENEVNAAAENEANGGQAGEGEGAAAAAQPAVAEEDPERRAIRERWNIPEPPVFMAA